MMEFDRLSLICPAHNEQGNVANLLCEWHAQFMKLGIPFELIVVDDGSTDETAGEVRRMQRELNGIRLLCRPRRGGQSVALASGIAHARGDVIVTCDADLQNDSADLPRMLRMLDECDVVCGWRHDRRDTLVRRLVSTAANRVLQRLFEHELHDVGCALRVFRRDVADRIPLFDGVHRFFAVVALVEGFRVVEVPVHHRARTQGVSKYGLFDRLWRTAWDLVGLCWHRSRHIPHGQLATAMEPAVETSSHDEEDWPAAIPIRPLPGPDSPPLRKTA